MKLLLYVIKPSTPTKWQEVNFFNVHNEAALQFALSHADVHSLQVESSHLKDSQALGWGGQLVTTYEARSQKELEILLAIAKPVPSADEAPSRPTANSVSAVRCCSALESSLSGGALGGEDRFLAALYLWYLSTTRLTDKQLVEMDDYLPLLLFQNKHKLGRLQRAVQERCQEIHRTYAKKAR